MRTLIFLLRTDQVGSALSAEMALVTSVTVGALYMGMADFSPTVNCEFQVSTEVAGPSGVEEENKARDDKKKKDEEEKKNQW
jgi:hypothetical protein